MPKASIDKERDSQLGPSEIRLACNRPLFPVAAYPAKSEEVLHLDFGRPA